MAKKINMEQLASLAGVSKSTVSRALNDSADVSEGTKERIRRLAFENDYRLTTAPWEWSEKKSPTVTVVLPTSNRRSELYSAPFALELIGRLADELAEADYNMLLTKLHLDREDIAKSILAKGQSDGIIVIGQRRQHRRLKDISREVPTMVVWGADLPDATYCTVGSDNRAGGKLATDHLARLGRKRIAFVGDRSAIEPKLRFRGYLDALAEHGLEQSDNLIIDTPCDRLSAKMEVAARLNSGLQFDAAFAANDEIAMSIISALQEANYSVPGDVAVVGFDDISMAEYGNPPLTTVRQDIRRGSGVLVDSLIRLMEGHSCRSTMVPVDLIVRRSCGAYS